MTPAVALLERERVPYTLHEYDHDPKAPSYGLEAAEKLGLEPARVFKTLVADVDGGLVCCVVPVDRQLDLRSLGKRARLAEPAEAERATINVSAGRRGLELELAPADLLRLTGGRLAACASA